MGGPNPRRGSKSAKRYIPGSPNLGGPKFARTPGEDLLNRISVLAKEIDDGGNLCAKPFRLSNCTEETISGLGSFLYMMWRILFFSRRG